MRESFGTNAFCRWLQCLENNLSYILVILILGEWMSLKCSRMLATKILNFSLTGNDIPLKLANYSICSENLLQSWSALQDVFKGCGLNLIQGYVDKRLISITAASSRWKELKSKEISHNGMLYKIIIHFFGCKIKQKKTGFKCNLISEICKGWFLFLFIIVRRSL